MINAIYNLFLPRTIQMHVLKWEGFQKFFLFRNRGRMIMNSQVEKPQGAWRVVETSWPAADALASQNVKFQEWTGESVGLSWDKSRSLFFHLELWLGLFLFFKLSEQH